MSKVSVVVPVYNAEKYIERCLESIVNQTYRDIEILLVNDGSVDDSLEICQRFCETDNRFKLINQNNQGPDIARRSGVHGSTGEYITFVDADDYIDSKAIEIMLKAAENEKADIVCSQIIRFNDSGIKWNGSIVPNDRIIIDSPQEAMKSYFKDGFLMGTYYAKIISRNLIDEYSFVEEALIGEDISAALYMYEHAQRIAIIEDQLYFYYWNPKSISHSGFTNRHLISLKNYINVKNHLLEKQYVEDRFVYGYFAEFEMAVATAMSRNWNYNKEASDLLRKDLQDHWKKIKQNEKTPLYMKICMLIFMTNPKLFMLLYKVIYAVTGR